MLYDGKVNVYKVIALKSGFEAIYYVTAKDLETVKVRFDAEGLDDLCSVEHMFRANVIEESN